MENFEGKNYYEALEIDPMATPKEIEVAYRKALNMYAEDSAAIYSIISREDSRRIKSFLEEAYSILSSPEKRIQYNKAKGLINQDERMNAVKLNSYRASSTLPTPQEARSKYLLEYDMDFEFEKEIENETQFTGPFLKKVREYKGVSLDKLSDYTKILKTYLVLIEEEDFEKLPATAYVRGFVFQYAKYLKLNPDIVSSSYIKLLKIARGELAIH